MQGGWVKSAGKGFTIIDVYNYRCVNEMKEPIKSCPRFVLFLLALGNAWLVSRPNCKLPSITGLQGPKP